MTRFFTRLFNRLFNAEAVGLILVAIALQLFIGGVSQSIQNTDTKYFYLTGLVAVLAGFGFGKANWKPYQATAGSVAVGVIGAWIVGARVAIPIVQFARAVLALIPQIIPAIRYNTQIDFTLVAESWILIAEASTALQGRLQLWLLGFNRNVIANDALIRNVIWLFSLWLLAVWLGWFTARRNAAYALGPAIIILAFVTSYSGRHIESIWGLVFAMLLLMGVWNYKNHTLQWDTRAVDYSDSIRYDVTQAVLILAIATGSIAFVTPSISWQAIRDYFKNQDRNQLAEAFGIKEQPLKIKNVAAPKPSLPRDHLLGGGFAQSEEVVMTIRTGELPPIVNPGLTANAPRYYWRSVIFDKYVGTGWVTSTAQPQKYSANTPLFPGLLRGYKPLHLVVRMAEPEGKLFYGGILFSADIPLTVEWRLKPTSSLFADQSTLIQADMFAAATNALDYTVESYVANATVAELRAASATEYPESISERYLVLPREIPERVRALAKEITKGKSTPYDKAKAIEIHLRSNYPYDLEVPAPPPDQDVADYFLFDLKKGYCDYFATAMVVLSRVSGIPARFVSGYAPGTYDAPNAQYIIREKDAHSWVEVYFPEIGWVEFEPTGSIPEILRKEKEDGNPPVQRGDTEASRVLNRFRLERIGVFLSPLLIILLALALYYGIIERIWYSSLAPATAIERIYKNLYRTGRPLTGIQNHSETANEFANRLIQRLNEYRSTSRVKGLFVVPHSEIAELTGMYNTVLFRDVSTRKHDFDHAWEIWKRIRWALWRARMITSSQRSRRRKKQ